MVYGVRGNGEGQVHLVFACQHRQAGPQWSWLGSTACGVESYLNGGRWTLVAEYVEAESGKRSDRPKLARALAHAKAIGATVVFAKLDRLTRNVDLLRSLVASDVDLVFCDLPHVPSGAMGRFLLTQMASVAELEVGLISERTRAALAAARHAA